MTDFHSNLPAGFSLEETPAGLELRRAGELPGQGVRADLHWTRPGPHPLRRALRGTTGPVVDATAGLGVDAGFVASLNRTVLAIERDPTLHALLCDAHARLADSELAGRITILHDEACSVLSSLPVPFERPAAIILDPMYPVRRSSSALPPKPMQVLRALLHDRDAPGGIEALVDAAFATPARRVVLKRPPEADPPSGVGVPTFSIETKLVRWDVWERGHPS